MIDPAEHWQLIENTSGEADEQGTLAASRSMPARGAGVTAVEVGPVGDEQSMLAAAPLRGG